MPASAELTRVSDSANRVNGMVPSSRPKAAMASAVHHAEAAAADTIRHPEQQLAMLAVRLEMTATYLRLVRG